MDVYDFLNSKDEAEYLRGIGYEPGIDQVAFIVHVSRKATLEQKCEAWLGLVADMPDLSMEGRTNMAPIPSFRTFLQDYVSLLRREIERFYDGGELWDYVYTGSARRRDADDDDEDANLFSDAEDCIEYLMSEYAEEKDVESFKVERRLLDNPQPIPASTLYLDRAMNVTSIWDAEESEEEAKLSLKFEGMWPVIPTPFKR